MAQIERTDKRMVANNLEPFYLTHPGEVIKDEIEYLGMSQKQLSADTGRPYTIINEIIHGKRQVSVEYAMLLDAALNLDADLLLKMQMDYNKEMALRNTTLLDRLKAIRSRVASVTL